MPSLSTISNGDTSARDKVNALIALVNSDLKDEAAIQSIVNAMRADLAQAQGGELNSVLMTPVRTKQYVNAIIASLLDAQTGLSNSVLMTPTRVRDLLDAFNYSTASSTASAIAAEATARDAAIEDAASNLVDQPETVLLWLSRPADDIHEWTSSKAGGPAKDRAAVTQSTTVHSLDGNVLRMDGAGVVAWRRYITLEEDRVYQIRAAFRRDVNVSDPSGDAVSVGMLWYDEYKTLISQSVLSSTSPTTGDGRQTVYGTVSITSGLADKTGPDGAVYGCPYIQTYGSNGRTLILYGAVLDITSATVYAPDVSAVASRVTAIESLDLDDRLTAAEAAIDTPESVTYATMADALAAAAGGDIPASVNGVRTLGYGEIFDGGGSSYVKVGAEPVHDLWFQDSDLNYWEISETNELSVAQAGAVGDNVTDDTDAILAAIAYMDSKGGGTLYFNGQYKCSDEIVVDFDGLHIKGVGQQPTLLDFSDQVSGDGLIIESNVEFWTVKNLRIASAYGHNLVIRSTSSGSLIPSRSTIRNVKSAFSRNGSGVYFEGGFLITMENVFCQGNARYGFEGTGYHTTLTAIGCQGLTNLLGGWKINDITYACFISCGADKNGDTNDDGTADGSDGYGYVLQNMQGFQMLNCGAESNMGAGILAQSTSAIESGAIAHGFVGTTIRNFFSYNNNRDGVSGASFLDFVCDTATTNPRMITIDGCIDRTPNGSPSVKTTGECHLYAVGDVSLLAGGFDITTFSTLDTDRKPYRQNTGLSITAADTPVCSLSDAHRQGEYYCGMVTVTARSKKWADAGTGSNVAVYQLLVAKHETGNSVVEVAKAGETAGGGVTQPSFTWTLDGTNNHLEATPVASTSGTFYFNIECQGDLFAGDV